MSHHRAPLALAIALASLSVHADHMEEVVVTGIHDSRTIDVQDEIMISPDPAQLLKKAPGANVNSNGPLTGIPQYRGMFGSRVATAIDGSQVAPSGPNWMDPPLSYAMRGQLESLEIYRGIAPVSVAQESIGGAISARSRQGEFASSSNFSLTGNLTGSVQSANSGYHTDGALYGSNNHHRFKIAGMIEAGDDAEYPSGDITPTEFERKRYNLGYGYRSGNHTVQVDYGYNDTSDTGTPALPMDIGFIEGDLYNLTYDFNGDNGLDVSLSLHASDLDHGMTNYELRRAPGNKAMWRRNLADSENAGFKLQATLPTEQGYWNFGADGFSAEHNSDIDNPNNPMFFVVNFNQAQRDVFGVFLERQQTLNSHWRGELGARYNRVEMDADEVDGMPAKMGPAKMLRDAFNGANREQNDDNLDLVAKLWFDASANSSWYLGLAQKHRSPSYQERYLWLPMEATGGLADGFVYTGNIELDPEVSRQIEFGLDFNQQSLTLSPRLFYSSIDDYIQGTPSEVAPAVMFVRMMNTMNGTNRPDPLQFNNVDAEIYGFDMDWAWQFDTNWSLSGLVNYVRGKRRDISDNLYRIAPPNTTISLNYSTTDWGVSLENVLYASQEDVSDTNNEKETAGYGVLNLHTSWQMSDKLQLAAGIDNLLDKEYYDHLGGYNRAANPDLPIGSRLPGYGTNVFARLSYTF